MKYTQEQLRKMLVSIYECASAWDNDDGKMAEANEKIPEDILAEIIEEANKKTIAKIRSGLVAESTIGEHTITIFDELTKSK